MSTLVDKIIGELPAIIEDADGYSELYGVELSSANSADYDEPRARLLIEKLCTAYKDDEAKVRSQLVKILKWRAEFNPLSCGFKERHHAFLESIGIITAANGQVITWNIYGALVARKDEVLNSPENLAKFLRYRIGLMERGVHLLLSQQGTQQGTAADLYMVQVHDYAAVSMFNRDPNFKKTVKQIIEIFQEYYPEWLRQKFFVNVHWSLSFLYDVFTVFISSELKKKFVVLNDANKLGKKYLPACVPETAYGGDLKGSLQDWQVKEIKPDDYILKMILREAELD